ncbi:heat-shock protein [Buchnera aphidicola (Melanaphis sacchari)]|uniref:Heat-shock protein n=1 Tax=Buchnera aphidicola (Melanaphis sacchari) TaxID=2173854 RepID=A0A2U8DEG4_9GAMM|nr:Hsp20 family protein [Buchnera aphidicola]AWH90248.1 heat-shock protein [Buchnera aphidicola (Melanaphis sacchari)]
MSYNPFSFLPSINNHSVFSDRFNQIDKMFSTLTGEKPLSENPLYNLSEVNENQYELILSIPGYKEKELDISVHDNQLLIRGKKEKQNDDNHKKIKKWLHRNIFLNNFSLSFNFDHKIHVKKAELSLGLLKINFEYQIPEKEKPKKIFINIPNNDAKISKK